jgi:hypothetical protein
MRELIQSVAKRILCNSRKCSSAYGTAMRSCDAFVGRVMYLKRNSSNQRSLYTYSSLHEASFFPQDYIAVTDDGNDASKYGYRVFVTSSPTGGYYFRQSSSSTHRKVGRSEVVPGLDDYSQCMQTIDPRSLDILSSPEVIAILESQRDWDNCGDAYRIPDDTETMISAQEEDLYLSDCEELREGWNSHQKGVETFEKFASLDEKIM